ncbi:MULTISPECIES: hypothetical protein [unclassified Legionella]|uniref:hypothetical protein n=1 Tax=unclassified Legionella TaxID=2622702 RepID=UPI001E44CCE8|nr:hypothetical protein [Legionella sp. 31fI33]MCC5015258.1 hypothetical protein [Legionella sp. 31fI33]
MGTYWKYKHLGIFAYAEEENTAAPTNDMEQARRDWNRWARSGEKCPILINGLSLPQVLINAKIEIKDPDTFANNEELINFFKKFLFANYPSADQDELVLQALMHFHQAGFPFATNYCVSNVNSGLIRACEPQTTIDFVPTGNGLQVKEEQIYKKLSTSQGIDEISGNGYHAKTTTTSLFNPQGITLLDLEIDCPSSNAATIFDKRKLWDQICQYVKNILIDYKFLQDSPAEVLEGREPIVRFNR